MKDESKFDLKFGRRISGFGSLEGKESIPGRVVGVRSNSTSLISLREKSPVIFYSYVPVLLSFNRL